MPAFLFVYFCIYFTVPIQEPNWIIKTPKVFKKVKVFGVEIFIFIATIVFQEEKFS